MESEQAWRKRIGMACEKAAEDHMNMSALARECDFSPSGLRNFRRDLVGGLWKVQKLEQALQRRGYLPKRLDTNPNAHGHVQEAAEVYPGVPDPFEVLASQAEVFEAQCHALALFLRNPGVSPEDKARRLRTELEFLHDQTGQMLQTGEDQESE